MELVAARTLAELVQAQGPLPPGRVAEIGGQLAATLEAATGSGSSTGRQARQCDGGRGRRRQAADFGVR
jgi:hypothetical protein